MKPYTVALACIAVVLSSRLLSADVSSTMQTLRRHVLDADVNALTFHSMDGIFDTRRVDNGGVTWNLPRADHPFDLTYSYAGEVRPASAVLERTFTNALIILKHGKLVTEIYLNNTNAQTHFTSWSMAKSITSILIGLAITDGYIHSEDDPIVQYVPELKSTAYDGVTIKQALMMRSGANFEERYDFDRPGLASAAFEESLVEGKYRFASFARLMGRAHTPGEHFNYSTIETCVLGWVLERATKQTISHYMTERLWKPAGMESYGFWILDGSPEEGREFNGAGFNAVARDYARLGLLMLRQGKTDRTQLIPPAWVRQSTVATGTEPVAPSAPLGYQYQWWTLVDSEAFLAIGLQGQYIYVDPATETVVVKLSHFPPAADDAVASETLAFFRAVSAWNPP